MSSNVRIGEIRKCLDCGHEKPQIADYWEPPREGYSSKWADVCRDCRNEIKAAKKCLERHGYDSSRITKSKQSPTAQADISREEFDTIAAQIEQLRRELGVTA